MRRDDDVQTFFRLEVKNTSVKSRYEFGRRKKPFHRMWINMFALRSLLL